MSIKTILSIAIFNFALLSLGACGFSPVYGTHSATSSLQTKEATLNNIDIAIIPNREGQFLRNALIDRFYLNDMPPNAQYILRVKPIKERVYDLDITIDSEATRRQLKLSTEIQLYDKQTKKNVLSRNLYALASHNVLESEFSTIVTEQSAREDTLNDLARQIERELTLYLSQ